MAVLSPLQLLNLFLIFVRVLAVLMTAPVFNHQSIPIMGKIGFAGLLSMLLLPVELTGKNSGLAPLTDNALPLLILVAQEVLVGVLLGFVSNLVLVTIDMAARLVGLQAGFQAANLFDPFSRLPTSALEQFYVLIALVLFLAINGHHRLLEALAYSFKLVPLGTFAFTSPSLTRLIAFTGEILGITIRMTLPVVGMLLLVDLGLGLIARAVPQIQVFFLGLPVKMGLAFLLLALTIPLTLPFIKDLVAITAANLPLILKP